MSGLLLGTRALRKFVVGEPALREWLDSRDDTLHLSVFSIGEVLAQVEALKDVIQRRRWTERLTLDIPADFGPRLHDFDINAAKQWSALRAIMSPPPAALVESDLAVVAVALDRRLEYVAPRESWHDHISGLRQHDPWTEKSYPI